MPTFKCPTCGQLTQVVVRLDEAPYRPFCSQRCQLIDLYHWFEGRYRISDPLTDVGLDSAADGDVDVGLDRSNA